jgi:hypothetical protein
LMNYRKMFCTFADSRMRKSLFRITNQAKAMGFYDVISVNDERALDDEFCKRFKDRLIIGSRGYGYWVWKPQIILQALAKMNEGDILQYSDAGCHLNPGGICRLEEYFELARNSLSGILAFQGKFPDDEPHLKHRYLTENKWTKEDLFDYFKIKDERIKQSPQIEATNIFVKNCSQSKLIIKAWLQVYIDNFDLANDTPSKKQNAADFIEHRHDQSIFSLLCKINKVATVSAFEFWYPSKSDPRKPDWRKLNNMPIWAKRDKSFGLLGDARNLAWRIVKKLGIFTYFFNIF